MRKFWSYGPINPKLHYYAPRTTLIEKTLNQLVGEEQAEGGHYITVWASRQRGKTWVLQQVLQRLQHAPEYAQFDVLYLNVEHLSTTKELERIGAKIADDISQSLGLGLQIESLDELDQLFKRDVLKKSLILVIDEFDALAPAAIAAIARVFRNIYIKRANEVDKRTEKKEYLLHGLALIGVRSVLGIENETGSPFNVQRGIHIPNLTLNEVQAIYHWYERESGQTIEPTVIERIYMETQGQPGLTCWLGELLTETYNQAPDQPLSMQQLDRVLLWATDGLGNANIQNIISKAQQMPYKHLVLELFRTEDKIQFRFDDPAINFLYLNGVIDIEETPAQLNVRFPSPFIQRRLFNYSSAEIFPNMGQLYAPFDDLSDAITENNLNVRNLLWRYQYYFQQNRAWLLKEAPQRSDLRYFEAVFHFNLYMYLSLFFRRRHGSVYPEFPTGNGQIDLVIHYAGQRFGIEVKSFTDDYEYRQALKQAAKYGKQLGLAEITLVLFIEAVNEENRKKYEVVYTDATTNTVVRPMFIATGGDNERL